MSDASSVAEPPLPSERKFGLLFAALCCAAAVYGLFGKWPMAAIGAAGALGAGFLLAALAFPGLLAPLNRAWFALSLLLGRVVSPVVLGAMFFLLITPVAVLARLWGRDELNLRPRNLSSYWVERPSGSISAESFTQQF